MLIRDTFTAIGQTAEHIRVEEIDGTKYRILVRRDSYARQSYATVEVWSPTALTWRMVDGYTNGHDRVVALPDAYAYRAALARGGSDAHDVIDLFSVLADELLETARNIVGV